MKALESKVPPPVVTLVSALLMWALGRMTWTLDIPLGVRAAVALPFVLVGGAIGASGIAAFRRARTTLDPMKPETASALVTDGIYRHTRNPMYLGLAFLLGAWAVLLGAPWSLLGLVLFVVYLNRFQIRPEERALGAAFGVAYETYRAAVRRWL